MSDAPALARASQVEEEPIHTGVQPFSPVAVGMGDSLVSALPTTMVFLRHPAAAIGDVTDLRLPVAPVFPRLALAMLVLLIPCYAATLVLTYVTDPTWELYHLPNLLLHASFYLGKLLYQAMWSVLLAWLLLSWWRVPRAEQRSLDLAAILFGGTVVGIIASLPLQVVFNGWSVIASTLGERGAIAFAIILTPAAVLLEHGLPVVWRYRLLRPATAPAERRPLLVLLSVLGGAGWGLSLKALQGWQAAVSTPLFNFVSQ